MADAAVTLLLENLTQLLRYYVHLISEAENELEQLKNEVDLMKAFLVDAAQKPKKEETFREWERQIRKVVYEAEDTIDACLTHAASAKGTSKGRLDRLLRPGRNSTKRLSMAEQVKSLRESKVKPVFDQAKKDFVNVQSGDGSGTSVGEHSTKPKKVPLIKQDNIVGFEDEEKTIIAYLMEETKELDVVAIVGMAGLGKTTLAWKIFQNPEIQYEFPTCIWVYVSQEFNARDVFLNILKGFTSQDMSSMSDQDLVKEVRLCLQNGKFLLVIDDVWTVDAWNDIKQVLPKSNKMGKVLITSREQTVGTHANVARKPHQLRFLNPKESWELLQYEVFGNLEDCPKELKTIGEDIAEKCDGLPLALVIIGGILVDRLSTKEMIAIQNAWTKVCENVSIHMRNDKKKRMSEIVALSYNTLPHELKDCFLYLGVFPEDYEIPVWTLTRLWIAEGFVQRNEGQSLEETAEENLKDLINRNLVMVVTTNPNGQVKTCRVHDLIREFCNLKAGIAEQNLFQEIKKSKGVFEPPVSDIQKYRRLGIHFHLPEFLRKCPSGKQKGHHVRSFLCFYKEPILLDPKYISTIPDTFDLLRILDSKSIKFAEFPVKVTKLIHLRYITLSCDDLNELPHSITELWNLQTLVVDTNSRTLEIKASIWKMIQLRHLKTKAAIILATQGQGKGGENLQTLSRLSPKNCTQDVFERACNLKRLGVRGDLALLFKDMSLEILDSLENLKLVNDLFYGAASENPLRGLPAAKCFPQNIKTLTLAATFLEWTHMSTLGMINSLQVLKLKQNAFKGKSWQVVDNGFRGLQFLLIASTDLHRWETSDDKDHFPSLRRLVLKNCRDLRKIPLGLAKTLQVLEIERVSKSAVESAREIEKCKKEVQGQQKGRWGEFKLSVGPGCE